MPCGTAPAPQLDPENVGNKITSCLWFDTEAEDAAQFYTSVFPESHLLEVSRYGDAGPGPARQAMTVSFELAGCRYVALNGGPVFTFNEAISFQVDCASQEEVAYVWSTLSDGGEEEVWVAEGPVRSVVAGQLVSTAATASGPGPGSIRTSNASHARHA